MTANTRTVIGIDVGGTGIKAARFAGSSIDRRIDLPTPSTEVLSAVLEAGRALMTADVTAIGVAVPGSVEDGTVRYSTNVGWADVPLRAALSGLGVPVAVGNDVNAAALAEGGDLLFVALGTGVGGAIVSGGSLLTGARGLAGEIGHVPVRPDGEACECGQRGCLETYASARAVVRRYGAQTTSAADVVARLATDARARAVWQEATAALGLALASATLLVDPPRIVLGGGLAAAGAALLEPVRDELARRLVWRTPPPVEIATDPADAGLRGAALLAGTAAGTAAVLP
jgi:glucokinase